MTFVVCIQLTYTNVIMLLLSDEAVIKDIHILCICNKQKLNYNIHK